MLQFTSSLLFDDHNRLAQSTLYYIWRTLHVELRKLIILVSGEVRAEPPILTLTQKFKVQHQPRPRSNGMIDNILPGAMLALEVFSKHMFLTVLTRRDVEQSTCLCS